MRNPDYGWEDVLRRPQDFDQRTFELVKPFKLEVFIFKDDEHGVAGIGYAVGWGYLSSAGKRPGVLFALWVPDSLDIIFPRFAYWEGEKNRWRFHELRDTEACWQNSWLRDCARVNVQGLLNAWRMSKTWTQ